MLFFAVTSKVVPSRNHHRQGENVHILSILEPNTVV